MGKYINDYLSSKYTKYDALYIYQSEESNSQQKPLEVTKILNKYGKYICNDPLVFRKCENVFEIGNLGVITALEI